MNLLDHQNIRAKLIILISLLICMIMAILATQVSDTDPIHNNNQDTYFQINSPQSMAYFNPETGTFTTKLLPTTEAPTTEEQSGIQARSALLQAPRGQLTQDRLPDSAQTEPQAFAFKEYNNSLVIPAPRSLHSKLVAYRPSEAEIKNGANSIIYKHEDNTLSQPEQPGL